MQKEITKRGPLLNDSGELVKKGWARKLLREYDRDKISACECRIKEWDYYAILNESFGIAFTVADLGYIGLVSAVWLDFEKREYFQDDNITFFPLGKFNLSSNSEKGDIKIDKNNLKLSFENYKNNRILKFKFPNFSNGKGLAAHLKIDKPSDQDSIVIISDWKKDPQKFYYNQKINCMPTEGIAKFDGKTFDFGKKKSYGVLDWGRGVWTYENTWYWGSVSTKINGNLVGWNLGYGFSDRSLASENAIFYEGNIHKLDKIKFIFDENNLLKPWRITSNDNRFEMKFKPMFNRRSYTNLILMKSEQNQVFGKYSGHFILDNGKKVKVNDVIGFAEKVFHRW